MKTIQLLNPRQAQQIFIKNNWKNQSKFYIKASHLENETTMVDANNFLHQIEAEQIFVCFGSNISYNIPLDAWNEEVITLELKDITDTGIVLFIHSEPHFFRVYSATSNESINKIGQLYPQLKIIEFYSSNNLVDLSPLAALVNLNQLNLSDCENLVDLSPLAALVNLNQLDLSDCKNLVNLSPLATLVNLNQLNLSVCYKIYDLSPLATLVNLNQLNLSYCFFLVDLSPLAALVNLNQLKLSGCEKLVDLSPLAVLVNLNQLNLSGDNLVDLSPLAALVNLNQLDLLSCKKLVDLSPLVALVNLNQLDLLSCKKLVDLSPLATLVNLNQLHFSGCENIVDLSPLAKLVNLNQLHFSGCENIVDLSPIAKLVNLNYLNLIGCKKLVDLSPLATLVNLNQLELSGENIVDLSPLAILVNLNQLKLNGENIVDLSLLAKLVNLNQLKLSGENIVNLSPLATLVNLNHLDLSDCKNLVNLSPLATLVNLNHLDLCRCPKLKDLIPLSGLYGLSSLNLSSSRVFKVSPIKFLPNLKKLNLIKCPNIRDFETLSSLPQLEELSWIDPLACSLVLIQSTINRKDDVFITQNAEKWINEIESSKEPILFVAKLIASFSILHNHQLQTLLTKLSNAMRMRGLQADGTNDLDAITWEGWCNLVLQLDCQQALDCFADAINDLNIQRETEVLLGPIIIAASEIIEKYPDQKLNIIDWVNHLLQQLNGHPIEERQIAPSAAVFFASLYMKEDVLFWLQKATDEKLPIWREKVLYALIKYFASKANFSECRRLLDQMYIQDEKDKAIAELAQLMAQLYPIDGVLLMHEIQYLNISNETACKLLYNEKVLQEPQGIYQLLLHLQSNPDELASTLKILIEKDTQGNVAEAVKNLFLKKQANRPSAAVMLSWCSHPLVKQFVKAWKLEELIKELREAAVKEQELFAREFFDLLERKNLIDTHENEIMKAKSLN